MASNTTQAGWGINQSTLQQVDVTHKASRVSLRPIEKGVFGSYRLALASAAFAAGALTASPFLAFQWTSSSANALIKRVKGAIAVTTAFAQGNIVMDMIRATKTGSGQYTGGSVLNLIGKDQAASTRMATSQQKVQASATGSIAIANAAALAAPGTGWTFDSNPMAALTGSLTTGLPTGDIFAAQPGDEPFELQNGEGFLIRNTWPITGVAIPSIIIEWDEVDPARYFM